MKYNKIIYLFLAAVVFSVTSCVKDLDVTPIDKNIKTPENVFTSEESYKQALAKVYASYAIGGQQGNDGGDPDIIGIDEGFGNYTRLLWNIQELPTDEAIMAWDDATIKSFHTHEWAPNDIFLSAMFSRVFYTIAISNSFIRVANEKLPTVSGKFAEELELYIAEARYLRAHSYWHALDLFGNVPFVTEANAPGAYMPERIERAKLFDYVVSELKDIETKLAESGANEYARVDRVAAWMLLAKLYQNAEVYAGKEMYTESITYLDKVIGSTYTLDENYQRIFSADNYTSPEIIFPIAFDGINTQQSGGMTFLIHASVGSSMPTYGILSGWGGIRAISNLVEKFGASESDFGEHNKLDEETFDPADKDAEPVLADQRGKFYHNPTEWSWKVSEVGTFTHGIGVVKFRNVTADGGEAPNKHESFVSTDFPVFRLSDAYLMYAESVARGGQGGDVTKALEYVNALRKRAYNNTDAGAITAVQLTPEFILDERARELYWEGHRRTDLIRHDKFSSGDYLWEWKGNSQNGVAFDSYRSLFPIPTNDLLSNTNLIQNDGY